MNLGKHSGAIALHYLTCAGTAFASDSPGSHCVTYIGSDRETSKDELVRENEANVQVATTCDAAALTRGLVVALHRL